MLLILIKRMWKLDLLIQMIFIFTDRDSQRKKYWDVLEESHMAVWAGTKWL